VVDAVYPEPFSQRPVRVKEAERLGADMLPIVCSICVGSNLVDVSPLSTTGALCIAAAPATENHAVLFNKMLAWGLSMTVVGAAISWLFFGLL